MAKDKLYEDSQTSTLDSFIDGASTVLAVGAGTAAFLRANNGGNFARQLERTTRVVSSAFREIDSHSAEDWGQDEIHRVMNVVKDQWRNAGDMVDTTVNLRMDDTRSTFGAAKEFFNLTSNPNKVAKEMAEGTYVIQPTIRDFVDKYAKDDRDMALRIENYTGAVYGHLDEAGEFDNFAIDHFRGSNAPSELPQEILKALRKRRGENKDGYKDFIDPIQEAAQKLIDPDMMERQYGSASSQKWWQKVLDSTTGTRAATHDDLYNAMKRGDIKSDAGFFYLEGQKVQTKSVLNGMEEIKERLGKIGSKESKSSAKYGSLYVDASSLRVDKNGKLFSMKATSNFLDDTLKFASETLPGVLTSMRDTLSKNTAPVFATVKAGSMDPLIARSIEKGTSSVVSHNYIHLYDTTYRINSQRKLEQVKELDGAYLISGTTSMTSRLYKKMFGDAGTRTVSPAMKKAGIGEDHTMSELEEFISIFNKKDDPHWVGNSLKRAIDGTDDSIMQKMFSSGSFNREAVDAYITDNREVNNFMRRNNYALGNEAMAKLKEQIIKSGKMTQTLGDYFDMLDSDNDAMVDKLSRFTSNSIFVSDSFHNKDLAILTNSYLRNGQNIKQMQRTKESASNFFSGYESEDFHGMLRTEIGKEIFANLEYAGNNGSRKSSKGAEEVLKLIEDADLQTQDKKKTKRLAIWSLTQSGTGIVSKPMNIGDSDDKAYEAAMGIFTTMNGKSDFHKELRKTLKEMASERIDPWESERQLKREGIVEPSRYNQFIHVKKAINPLDLIRPLNDSTNSGKTLKDFFKQLLGGRDNPDDVTAATLGTYFFASRLSDGMNYGARAGLGPRDMGSTYDVMKGLILKRVLPVAIGLTYLDYSNDAFRDATGNSLAGTAYQGVANTDLALRRGMDVTGFGSLWGTMSETDPLIQYWFGKDGYQDAQEREKWYKSGYSPYRKNRFWFFGSASEIRGGKIDHWEASFLRAETSNYKDKTLYDGFSDKWSHSLLPTPTSPLSPLAAILDPYWLENKHYNDRPYPVSGSLFAENTPWGFVLNPTVGELIKPRKMMHTDRLDGGMVDVMTLIERENEKVYRQSEEHYFKLKNGSVQSMDFSPYGATTLSDRTISLSISNGNIVKGYMDDYGRYPQGMTANEYDSLDEDAPEFSTEGEGTLPGFGGKEGSVPAVLRVSPNKGEEPIGLTKRDRVVLAANTGGILSPLAQEYLYMTGKPTNQLEGMNQSIIDKAKTRKAGGVFTGETMWNETSMFGDRMLGMTLDEGDLRSVGDVEDTLREASIIGRQLGGIYGWSAGQAFNGGAPVMHMANANAMNGYQRSFWEMNIGGLGGEAAEIGRRFIPEYKRRNELNPLLNEMPDWLPDRFRFGDPYTSASQGEARLPGKGYESLNKLHPDQFGEYGAFDRFKILADLAPTSPEYKVWRELAKKTVVSREQRDEIKEITSRVHQQMQEHDFYEYKFLGRGVEKHSAIVSEILDNNHFKIYGDEQIYRLSGVRVTNDKNNNQVLPNYLHSGQNIILGVDENEYYRQAGDSKHSVNADVLIGGESLSQMLLEQGLAKIRKGDTSSTAVFAKYGSFHIMQAKAAELITHIDVPFFSDKFARIRSPLESYKAEQVYGTPYQSWDHPIDSFLLPALERTVSSGAGMLTAEAGWLLHHYAENKAGMPNSLKRAANFTYIMGGRGAFSGYVLGKIINGSNPDFVHKMTTIGMLVHELGYTYTHPDELEATVTDGAFLGWEIGGLVGKQASKFSKRGKAMGAVIGGTLGLMVGITNKEWLDDWIKGDENRPDWIPERTKKKWELQEYFDRLRYVKYMGLYEKAAQRAYEEEDVDVKEVLEQYDRDTDNRKEIKDELKQAKAKIKAFMLEGNEDRRTLLASINAKIQHLDSSELIMKGGEYTHAAIMYKQAAESTSYGLKETATYVDIIRSLPKQDRDYFIEMVKEKDPEKQDEILAVASPPLRKALKRAWRRSYDEDGNLKEDQASNEEYFENHELPGIFWSGWRPDVDLRDVEVKTVYNEGMLLSDLGFYETQLSEDNVINAPTVQPFEPSNPISARLSLMGSLKGMGLGDVEVRVEPSRDEGIQTVFNVARIADYKIRQKVSEALSF